MFSQVNIVPRWIVFCLDLFVCGISLCFAYLLKYNFIFDQINGNELSRNILIFSAVNSIIFLIIKTYRGIIRYTSAQDSFRILFSILITNSIFFIFNLFLFSFNQVSYISNVILVINGLTGFLLLITYRVMVKYFFMYVKNFRIDKHRVIIYGAGEGGIAAKRTLDHDIKINMLLTAFIDDDERKTSKAIDGIKIYHTRDFLNLIKNDKIDDLIIASQNIPPDQKNKIVDICLENDIKVLTLPPIRSWINGQLSSRQLQSIKIEDLLEREPIDIHNDIICDQIKGKRVLVTGAAGSIGSEIVRQISQFHPQMIILNDQSETPLHELQLELQESNIHNNFHSFIGDIRDSFRMDLLFQTFKPHYVYHAAAYKHVP